MLDPIPPATESIAESRFFVFLQQRVYLLPAISLAFFLLVLCFFTFVHCLGHNDYFFHLVYFVAPAIAESYIFICPALNHKYPVHAAFAGLSCRLSFIFLWLCFWFFLSGSTNFRAAFFLFHQIIVLFASATPNTSDFAQFTSI